MSEATAFKILTAEQWQSFQSAGIFEGAPVDLNDGFIHLSAEDQVLGTLEKHFSSQDGLTIAEIALASYGDAVRWEESRGGALFPHIYAPLRIETVISARSG